MNSKNRLLTLIVSVTLIVLMLSGCAQVDNTLTINKDGSGSFDSITYMDKAMMDDFLANNDKGIDNSILDGTTVVTLEDGKEYYSRSDSKPFSKIEELNNILHSKNEAEADAAGVLANTNETQNPGILDGLAEIKKIDGITYLDIAVSFSRIDEIALKYRQAEMIERSTANEYAKMFRTSITINLPAEIFSIDYPDTLDVINNGNQVTVNCTPGKVASGIVIRCMLDNDGSAVSPVVKPFDNGTFTDVSFDDWFYVGVGRVYMQGLMTGVSEDSFNPNGTMSVAEAITLTARLHSQFNKATIDTTVNPGEAWYQPYVNYLVNNSAIASTEFDNYARAVTRAEMAHLMYKATPADQLTACSSLTAPDVKGNAYANEIQTLYKAGVFTGNDESGTFAPNSNITRAEIAMIAARLTNEGLRAAQY